MQGGSQVTEKQKLLIYAHYYVPDVASTGQILQELAEGLADSFNVTIICVVPSYGGMIEKRYKKQKYFKENINGVQILRIRVPEFRKHDKLSRIRNIFGYFFGAMLATFKVGKQDYVFSISQPPVLGGLLGVWGKWMKKAKYVYNIQDFNPEQIIAVGYSKCKVALKIMMWLDKFSCRQSDLVITVSRDLGDTLIKRFRRKKIPAFTLINNWIDEKSIYPLPDSHEQVTKFKKQYGLDDKFVIMYSGNLGIYYDLENLMKVIEKFGPETTTPDGKKVVFAFIGAGSVLERLLTYKKEHGMSNVIFIPYQRKENLIYSLNAGDVHWCVNARGIKGVSCPSKYYGIAAVAKPVLGVLEKGSEVRMLIEETRGGYCAEPGDYRQVERNIRMFIECAGSGENETMGERGRAYLMQNLTKEISIEKYRKAIMEC